MVDIDTVNLGRESARRDTATYAGLISKSSPGLANKGAVSPTIPGFQCARGAPDHTRDTTSAKHDK